MPAEDLDLDEYEKPSNEESEQAEKKVKSYDELFGDDEEE